MGFGYLADYVIQWNTDDWNVTWFMKWMTPWIILACLPEVSYISILFYDQWYFSMKKATAMAYENSENGIQLMETRIALQKKIRKYVEKNMSEKTFSGDYEMKDGKKSSGRSTGSFNDKGSYTKDKDSNSVHPPIEEDELEEGIEDMATDV